MSDTSEQDLAALAPEAPEELAVDDGKPHPRRFPWSLIVKALVTAGLAWLIADKVDIAAVADRFRAIDAGWLLLALVAVAAQLALAALRWELILKALHSPLGGRKVVEIFLIGLFFNQALPSSIGGDALRIWRSYNAGLRLGRAVSSVLLDRALGFVALFVLAAGGLPWSFQLFGDHPMRWAPPAFIAAALLGLVVLLLLDRLPQGWQRWRIVRGLAGLARDGRQVLLNLRPLLAMLAVGLGSAVSSVGVVWLLSQALGLPLSYLSCLMLVPILFTVTAVPISLAGWGLREGAAIFLFGLVGLEEHDALALSLAYGLMAALTSLPGGVVWALTRERDRRAHAVANKT